MNYQELNKKIKNANLDQLERKIMDKANFDYICLYNGKVPLRTCVRNAVCQITQSNEPQFCSLFGIYNSDIEQYSENIYNKMKSMGAE